MERNRELRAIPLSESMEPLDGLLFFADAPNGDTFAFPVADGQAQDGPITLMSHEDFDTRSVVADSLHDLMTAFLQQM